MTREEIAKVQLERGLPDSWKGGNGMSVTKPEPGMMAVERALIGGDLSQLTEVERLSYYKATCESLGLNPLTKPFDYIELNGKLTLYAKRDCTDQLRKIHGISVKIMNREVVEGVYVVTAQARTAENREDESVGAVPIVKEGGQWKTSQNGKRFYEGDGSYLPLKPEDKANAIMKAETKAKRRVTLSICGLGLLDESEFDTIGELRNRQTEEQGRVRDAKLKELSTEQHEPEPEAGPSMFPAEIDALFGHPPLPPGAITEALNVALIEMGKAFPTTGADEYRAILEKNGIERGKKKPTIAQARNAACQCWTLATKTLALAGKECIHDPEVIQDAREAFPATDGEVWQDGKE